QLIKANPESEWRSEAVPHLRIVSDELWEAVQVRRKRHTGTRPEVQRRPKHMLSGLGVCGVCGGGWTLIGNGYWGCGRRKDAGACSNTRTIKTETYEQRVLAGLKSQMLQPDVVETYVR